MSSFHGCLCKNKDGTNTIIKRNFVVFVQQPTHSGKKQRTLILKFGLAHKS